MYQEEFSVPVYYLTKQNRCSELIYFVVVCSRNFKFKYINIFTKNGKTTKIITLLR